jgi:hypothetical protein
VPEPEEVAARGTIIVVATRRALALVTLALLSAACTSAGRAATTTSAGNPNWYPPFINTAPQLVVGCIGRKPTGLTAAQATKIVRAVQKSAGGTFESTASCPGGPVVIGLMPGQEGLADSLLAEYGKNVAITVGFLPYDGSPVRSPTCGQVAVPMALPAGLHLSLRLKDATVRSGADFDATLVVSDSGPGTFAMDTGQPLVAVVVRAGTRQVVGVYSGLIAGTGHLVHLTPGQTGTVSVFGGTARCDGGMGSALPPGTYQVVVQVSPEGRIHTPNYLTPPVPLVVTEG